MPLIRAVAEPVALRDLRVDWFDEWNSTLDRALAALPEMEPWPHELFERLVCTPCRTRKRVALVTRDGAPVALAGLRLQWGFWEPVTNWILPRALFPVRPGALGPVLAGLRKPLRFGCWRWDGPPAGPVMQVVSSGRSHVASLAGDFERHWKEAGHWNTVRRMRNRCRGFHLEVNQPGAAEAAIRRWEATWRSAAQPELTDLPERLVAAEYLERIGRHFTLTLLDGSRPVAHHTFLVHGRDLVWQVHWRDPEYDHHGVGTRLMDAAFHWARDQGYERLDLGGVHDYKRRWAPESGWRGEVEVRPRGPAAAAGRAVARGRARLRRLLRGKRPG